MPASNARRAAWSMSAALWLLHLSVVFGQESADGKVFTQQPEVARTAEKTAEKPAQPGLNLFGEGPAPSWIWGADANQRYVVRTTFRGPAQFAFLRATCDNAMTVWFNGQKIAASDSWENPVDVDIKGLLKPGENLVEAEIVNQGGIAGFCAKVALLGRDGQNRFVVTDGSWQVAESRDARTWVAARVVAPLAGHPGGTNFVAGGGADGTPRDVFNLPPGFQVEKLFTVPKEKLGSWVNITTDPKGRLIVSDQGDLGLCRITPPAIGSQEMTKVEHLDLRIGKRRLSAAQGLLWAFDSLYVVCNGGPGSGLYRCRDTNGDDQLDEVVKLRDIPGGGEHGPHAVRLSPDGKSLYVAAGNHTRLPFEVKTNAPPRMMGGQRAEQLRASLPEGVTSRIMPNWDEDLLLPRQWDGGGHATGILAPGGWVCRTDPDGQSWEVFTMGYRNEFDFAFNADGEMFVYDADMEWDFGSPWYRPTRVVHATSGSEFGWRSGTGKWPVYYPDSLPELINIGPGSPVGVEFGYGTKFPARYQKALYLCDWTFGTMYAVHIEPHGASYRATKEEFVSRTPLPLTDCTVGKDGALYFTIGGRGAQSELFRVTYVGPESTERVDYRSTQFDRERQDRRRIETFHSAPVGKSIAAEDVAFLVQQLGHADRFHRYAARVALERLPLASWQNLVLSGNAGRPSGSPDMIIHGCVGLARQGEPALLPELLATLNRLDFVQLSESQRLDLLRAYQLALVRLGNPDEKTAATLARKFEDLFPQPSEIVNRELAILMIHLPTPGTVKKLVPLLTRERVATQEQIGELLSRNRGYGGTIAAMLANQPDQQQYHYAFHLRNLKVGWTIEDRITYFRWFEKARTWSGGASYQKFLNNIDKEAFANATDVERLAVEALGVRKPYVLPELPKPAGPGRDYSVADVIGLATTKLKGRNFKNGEKTYKAARCVVCHRFGGDGGATGPDLTQLAGRYSIQELTEALLDPSKVISDQYKASVVETKDGKVITGRIVSETQDTITMVTDPENATKTAEIKKSDIEQVEPSPVSLMPKDLLKPLNEQEVLDLMAYLLSRGNPSDAMFR